MKKNALHPCLTCGACCAVYRVSFHWSETRPESFQVPDEFVTQVTPHRLALKFQSDNDNRCIALKGKIGHQVKCSIYTNRPSPCRSFKASYENGKHDQRCDEARKYHNLEPLRHEDWPPQYLNLNT